MERISGICPSQAPEYMSLGVSFQLKRDLKRIMTRQTVFCTNLDEESSFKVHSLFRSYLDEASRIPFTPPKVERATATGIRKANGPYNLPAKVWQERG